MSEKPAKSLEMSSTDSIPYEMQRFVKVAAHAQLWGDNLKARLARAARILRISPRRAKAFYYLEARAIRAEEYMACKQIVAEIQNNASATENIHEKSSSLGTAVPAVAEREDQGTRGGHRDSVPAGDLPRSWPTVPSDEP